jgi:GTP1/Obg family GTP-binding protein
LELEIEKVETEQLKLEEQRTKKEFDKAITSILNNTSQEVNKFFEPLKEHIKAVALSKGNLNSLFIYGGGGLGKSTLVLGTLKELEQDYIYVSSYSTIVELVNFLYKNKDKNLVFDDFENLLRNEVALNILKSALWGIGKENKRIVSYLTTSQKLTAPSQFEFKGKCFFCLNEIPNDNPLLKALFSRALKYNLDFKHNDLMLLLAEISKLPYKELSAEQRQEVFNFIKENTDETCKELSIRTLIKAFDLFETLPDLWKNITKRFLEKDKNLSLLKKLLNENFSLKDVEHKYCEQLNFSRRTFYNHLKELKLL